MSLKFANVAKYGDLIRAFDHEPRRVGGECFLEGRVIATHDKFGYPGAFTVEVTRDVWLGEDMPEGQHSRVGREFCVPMGLTFGDWDDRVTKINPPLPPICEPSEARGAALLLAMVAKGTHETN